MAKEIKARVKMRLSGGAATPAPPVGSVLGQHQVNLMEFCKKFNALTADRKGTVVQAEITIYVDKTVDIKTKLPPMTDLIKKKISLASGSARPQADKVGKLTRADVEDIARAKMADLNAFTLEQAMKMVAGSARSMGVEVIDKA